MAKEIERKFLVKDHSYRDNAVECVEIVQGYVSTDPDCTVRVRIMGNKAFLTIKNRNRGAVRDEWEYPVSIESARELLHRDAQGVIEKHRYKVPAMEKGLLWEVDEFAGSLAPLVLAEIELPEATTEVALPTWVGKEVTGDARYYNSNLCAQA